MINNLLLRLRLQRGHTQEELSELSGISVRTIRNLERSVIQKPRRSSVDMLLRVLDPQLLQELDAQPVDELDNPVGMSAEWLRLIKPHTTAWQGSRPSRTSLVGRQAAVTRLSSVVMDHPVTVVTGPGGAGKTQLALAVAENVGHWFADGVVVAELGRIPAERDLDAETAYERTLATVSGLLHREADSSAQRVLLVLDNTEHLVQTTALLVERLLIDYPKTQILITSRRPPKLHCAVIWEIPPLSRRSSVELLLQRLAVVCPELDLSAEQDRLSELCEHLDRLPRLIEFAAHRLRMVSLPTLLSDSRTRKYLGSADFSTLPHQRTLAASVHWSLSLLDKRQQTFLTRLAGERPTRQPRTPVPQEPWRTCEEPETVDLLADLADSSLLQITRGQRYEYRILRHVQEYLADSPQPLGALS